MEGEVKALRLYRAMLNALLSDGIDELRVTLNEDKRELEVWVVTDEDEE